jgi:hypothetical protein
MGPCRRGQITDTAAALPITRISVRSMSHSGSTARNRMNAASNGSRRYAQVMPTSDTVTSPVMPADAKPASTDASSTVHTSTTPSVCPYNCAIKSVAHT